MYFLNAKHLQIFACLSIASIARSEPILEAEVNEAIQESSAVSPFDLTLLGPINFRGSLDRLPIAITELLQNDLTINHIRAGGDYNFTEVPQRVAEILKNEDKTPGNVALLINDIWNRWEVPSSNVPSASHIKIAYSLLESTQLPDKWVEILNRDFDSVVVADDYYLPVYENSGVTIPVFVLPHGIYIEEFLATPEKREPSIPFIFGCTSAYWPRKNQDLLIRAFHEEFGDDADIQLVLHGRYYENDPYVIGLEQQIKETTSKNIIMRHETLTDRQFKEFFKSLDCYVLISKGEGFSISPREALALGKPCIISNNTAHKTICNTGHVYAIPSEIEETAVDIGLGQCGNRFNCSIEDVRKALREVYTNYQAYRERALKGREWVRRYLWNNLKARFLNLIKPQKIILGENNIITEEYLMTNSIQLFEKYQKLLKKQQLVS